MIPEHKNYSLLIEAEESYPVLYTVSQNGTKVFRPQYISGKDLTESQIKYLDQIGYFGDTPTPPVVNEDESWYEVIRVIMENYANYNYPEQAVAELKKSFTITKK